VGRIWYRTPVRRESLTRRSEDSTLKTEMAELVTVLLDADLKLDEVTAAFQKEYVIQALEHERGNQCKLARRWNMHRNTLSRLIKELKIDVRLYRGQRNVRTKAQPAG
jgi:Fis family transcriptional regulator, factor for inversion stimulation protein